MPLPLVSLWFSQAPHAPSRHSKLVTHAPRDATNEHIGPESACLVKRPALVGRWPVSLTHTLIAESNRFVNYKASSDCIILYGLAFPRIAASPSPSAPRNGPFDDRDSLENLLHCDIRACWERDLPIPRKKGGRRPRAERGVLPSLPAPAPPPHQNANTPNKPAASNSGQESSTTAAPTTRTKHRATTTTTGESAGRSTRDSQTGSSVGATAQPTTRQSGTTQRGNNSASEPARSARTAETGQPPVAGNVNNVGSNRGQDQIGVAGARAAPQQQRQQPQPNKRAGNGSGTSTQQQANTATGTSTALPRQQPSHHRTRSDASSGNAIGPALESQRRARDPNHNWRQRIGPRTAQRAARFVRLARRQMSVTAARLIRTAGRP